MTTTVSGEQHNLSCSSCLVIYIMDTVSRGAAAAVVLRLVCVLCADVPDLVEGETFEEASK